MNVKNKTGFKRNKSTKLKCLKQDGRKKKVTAKRRLKNKKGILPQTSGMLTIDSVLFIVLIFY